MQAKSTGNVALRGISVSIIAVSAPIALSPTSNPVPNDLCAQSPSGKCCADPGSWCYPGGGNEPGPYNSAWVWGPGQCPKF
jgi:hypothetical protein